MHIKHENVSVGILAAMLIGLIAVPTFAQTNNYSTNADIYCPQIFETVVRGSSGNQVLELQKFLSDYYKILPKTIQTGYFGRITQGYVIQFQKEQGLPSFGVAGSMTQVAIAKVCTTKPLVLQSCPKIMTPQCTNGTLVSNGSDANGCSIGFSCTQISSSPHIQLLSPREGGHFMAGSSINARWDISGLPKDVATRNPKIEFILSDFDEKGNYGAYTVSTKQSNGVAFGSTITDINTILGGSASIPVILHHTSPNKFARGFLQIILSYDRQTASPASTNLTVGAINASTKLYDTTESEITISFPTDASNKPCFDDYQNWNLGGTWFANGERRSSVCLVDGPGSGTVDWGCKRPNICVNGQWQ